MPTVVGVRLRNAAKPVLFDTSGADSLVPDDVVVVSTDRGTELGRVAAAPRELEAGESLDSSCRIERVAVRGDLETAEALNVKEREAMPVYRRLVNKHKLDMKPTGVEFMFDGSKAIFYFVAEERVDFRDLVRELASEFHSRVDMRQIGVRDEARLIGGLGHCGEQLCCMRFGGEFQPVSIRMAKEQDLPLNPLKISGLCGRLMCCLRYENEAYKDFKGRAPKKGAIIEVGDTRGKVVEFNTPKETVTMRLEQGGSVTVGLADMDCSCGTGCPCRVRAEALESRAPSMGSAIGEVASVSGVPSRLRQSTRPQETARPKEAAQPQETAPAERAPRRRRRRGSGSGSGEGSAQAEGAQVKTPQPAPGPQQRQQKPRRSGERAQQQAGRDKQPGSQSPAAGAQTPPPAQGASTPTPGRRRRRRGSGTGGTPAAE